MQEVKQSTKKTFKTDLKNGRYFIPESHYFEWQNDNGKKQKFAFSIPHEPIMYLGGISKFDNEEGEYRFVILTREAAEHVSFIHNRMPVILPKTLHDGWLHGNGNNILSKVSTEVAYKME